MDRIALENGSWFDADKARKINEHEWWDGNNWISSATGSQWDHEVLHETAKGKWVLHHWSQRTGYGDSWELLTDQEAAVWLVENNREIPERLTSLVTEAEL